MCYIILDLFNSCGVSFMYFQGIETLQFNVLFYITANMN